MKRANKQRLLFLLTFSLLTANTAAVYEAIEKHPETELGEKAYAAGQYDEAIEHFQKAIDDGEIRGEPYFFTGAIMEYRRQYGDAIPWYVASLEHELTPELEKIALWKLIILYRNERSYIEMLTYIDRLEALGVTHKNIEKFKEEAQAALTPSKMEAYTLLKEAKELMGAFAKENPEGDFWDETQNKEMIGKVLYNYERAVYLDGDLFHINWELAGYYEKIKEYQKAFQTYNRILQKQENTKASYRAGVVLKKGGYFNRSLYYFEEALEKTPGKSQIHYYTLINISQVLFALGRFQEGQSYAGQAVEMEQKGQVGTPPFPVASLMSCINAATSQLDQQTGTGEVQLPKICTPATLTKNQKSAPAPLLPLYLYAQWSHSLLEKSNPKKEARLITALLVPPKMRNRAIAPADFDQPASLECDQIEKDKTTHWNCLPNWMESAIPRMGDYLYEIEDWRALMDVLLYYKKYLSRDSYDLWFAHAVFGLKFYEHAVSAFYKISRRSFEQEQNLILSLRALSRWEELQKEALSFYKSRTFGNYQEKKLWVEFIQNEKIPMQIPAEEIYSDFRTLFGGPDNSPEPDEPQEANSPEQQEPGTIEDNSDGGQTPKTSGQEGAPDETTPNASGADQNSPNANPSGSTILNEPSPSGPATSETSKP